MLCDLDIARHHTSVIFTVVTNHIETAVRDMGLEYAKPVVSPAIRDAVEEAKRLDEARKDKIEARKEIEEKHIYKSARIVRAGRTCGRLESPGTREARVDEEGR